MLPALPAAEKVLTASALTLLFVDWVAPISALPLAPFSTFFASVGLLALVATKVERAYANRVVLTFDKTIAEQICKLRFD